MDPADLLKFAAASGIDLNQIAGAASDLKGPARRRTLSVGEKKRRVELDLVPEVRETVHAKESRIYKPPAFTVAELGQAAGGLAPVPWAAALYSFAGANGGYWLIWNALSFQACRLARRDHWVPRVLQRDGEYRFYREELAELVLLEDANRQLFAERPMIYSDWLNIEPVEWDRHLEGPYRSLKDVYESWLGIARAAIGRWIRNDDQEREVDNRK